MYLQMLLVLLSIQKKVQWHGMFKHQRKKKVPLPEKQEMLKCKLKGLAYPTNDGLCSKEVLIIFLLVCRQMSGGCETSVYKWEMEMLTVLLMSYCLNTTAFIDFCSCI